MIKTKILIVEDEAVISMHIQSSLIKLGYEVCGSVSSGEEAIRMASELKPDLILMDILLQEGMDGIEAAKIIKDTLDIPVVYMTGNADVQTITRARETSPHGYVLKPINVLHLFSTIDTVLHRDQLEKSLKESGEALRDKTEELDRFFNLTIDLLCIAGTDGFFRRLNPSWETTLGFDLKELEGKRFLDFVHPDDIENTKQAMADLLQGKDVINFSNRYRCKDGSYRWIEWHSTPYQEKFIYAAARDITERKRFEEALEESEEKFRSLSDSSPLGVFYTDSSGSVLYTNKSFQNITGISLEDSLGAGWINAIHLDDRDKVVHIWEQTIRNKRSGSLEWRFITPEGDVRWVYTKIAAIYSDDGELTGYVGTNENITERKLAEDALRESEVRFRSITANLPGAVYQFYARKNGNMGLYYINDRGKEIFGLDSTPLENFFERFTLNVHPNDREAFIESIREVTRNAVDWHWEGRYNNPRGHEMWLSGYSYPSRRGTELIYNGLMLDITDQKIAERGLRESEEKFRGLVQNLQDIIIIMNPEGTVIYENTATLETLGYSLIGKNGFDIVHPDDLENTMRAFGEVIDKTDKKNRSTMFRARHAGGTWLYLDALGTNMLDNKLTPGILLVCRDVTQRMMVEAALLESEQRYRALFNQSPVGVLQFDTNGILTDCNDRLVNIMRSSRKNLIGLDLKALREKSVIPTLFEALKGKTTSYEGPYRATTSEAELFVALTVSPLYDDHGDVIGGIVILDDISDRKASEKKLKASEERSRLLIENASEGIAVLQERRFVFTNPQFTSLTGYSDKELGSRDFTDFVYHEDRRVIEERYIKRMKGDRTSFTYELRFISKEGIVKWGELNSVLFTWEDRPAVLLFVRDISERKQAEEEHRRMESQIQQTQKLESLGVLAGGIAHDFNNLLMAILGNIDLALLELTPSSPVRTNLLEAAKASQRAADLCRQMLAYSGKGKFKSETLNLNEIIEDMSHMLEVSISKKAILRCNYAAGLPYIEADATQMRQIIMNLIINASDAIGEKSGIISISTGVMDCDWSYLSETWLNEKLPEGQYVYLEVADTGCGMDQAIIPKIFDPFYTTKFTGRGLGLAAVFGIVRGHKGAIKVYSEKGRGTTFKILLPASEGTVEHLAGIHINGREWRGSGTILLADDEETIRTLGRRMLEHLGFTVLTASNGREVLDLFRSHAREITCIILDLTMPHMDGEEAFREIRRRDKNMRVIMSSGYNEQEITQRFAGRKIAGFIQKPYQLAELAAKLKEILG